MTVIQNEERLPLSFLRKSKYCSKRCTIHVKHGNSRTSSHATPYTFCAKSSTLSSTWVGFNWPSHHPVTLQILSKRTEKERHTSVYVPYCPIVLSAIEPNATEPSAITPDSTAKFRNPASPKHLPITASNLHIVWNTPILSSI